MIKLLVTLNIAGWLFVGFEVVHAVETKQVCHDVMVKGKTVNQCKTVKIHKKVEGTPVPDAPAKKAKK